MPSSSAVKLTCAVHGPKPLPRSAPFSPHLLLSAYVKLAPYATWQRKSYVRDAIERDLSVHLETALRGIVIGDRWPKSGVEIVVTVLESEEDCWWAEDTKASSSSGSTLGGLGMMTVLAGCINVASTAIADAAIDCVDLAAGGVAAIVRNPDIKGKGVQDGSPGWHRNVIVADPCPSEHAEVIAACVVSYIAARDEITELWIKGDPASDFQPLIDQAIDAAKAARQVLVEAVQESARLKYHNDTIACDEKSK